jgi:hypothetical protein
MGIIAFDVNQTWDFTLASDKGPEEIQDTIRSLEASGDQNTDVQNRLIDLHETLKSALPKTVFHLGHLDSALATYLMDSVADYKLSDKGRGGAADITFNVFQRDRELVRYGVKGRDNLTRADGTKVVPKFTRAPVGGKVGMRMGLSDDSLDLLIPYFAELARAVEAGNKLTEDETKNS